MLGRRLWRLHRRDRRARWRSRLLPRRQCLHPVPPDSGRQDSADDRRPEERHGCSAPGPEGHGRPPRLAVRLLHTRIRDVAVRPPQRECTAVGQGYRHRFGGKSLPMHGLWPHQGGSLVDERRLDSERAGREGGGVRLPASQYSERRHGSDGTGQPALLRPTHCRGARRSPVGIPGRDPARGWKPMSACG